MKPRVAWYSDSLQIGNLGLTNQREDEIVVFEQTSPTGRRSHGQRVRIDVVPLKYDVTNDVAIWPES
jgi:hypothetical protein